MTETQSMCVCLCLYVWAVTSRLLEVTGDENRSLSVGTYVMLFVKARVLCVCEMSECVCVCVCVGEGKCRSSQPLLPVMRVKTLTQRDTPKSEHDVVSLHLSPFTLFLSSCSPLVSVSCPPVCSLSHFPPLLSSRITVSCVHPAPFNPPSSSSSLYLPTLFL